MKSHAANELLDLAKAAIERGESVLAAIRGPTDYPPAADKSAWLADCRHLVAMLGAAGKPWAQQLSVDPKKVLGRSAVEHVVGSLWSLQRALEEGRLHRYEDLIRSDVFGDLLEQADYLEEKRYSLAAAVVCGAVLEEHMRQLAIANNCLPTTPRPAMDEVTTALAKAKVITSVDAQHVRGLAAVRNAAAHNTSDFRPADVPGFLRGVKEFISNHPI